MKHVKESYKDSRYRSYVGDVKNKDIEILIEIAYLEGRLSLMSPGWESTDDINRFEELTGINWGETYWMD